MTGNDDSYEIAGERTTKTMVEGRVSHWLKTPASRQLRVKYFLTGVVFPFVTLVSSASGADPSPMALWQSGEIDVYVSLLLLWNQTWVFLPLVTFSMVCMALWTFKPKLGSRRTIRFGIYTGATLSAQFAIQEMILAGGVVLMLTLVVALGLTAVVWLLGLTVRRTRKYTILEIMGITTIVAFVAAFVPISLLVEDSLEMLAGIASCLIITGAPLAFVTFTRASVYFLVAKTTSPRSKGAAAIAIVIGSWIAWLLAWGLAWRIAIVRMQEAYTQLPTSRPDCFVCSAAAYGHTSIVRSREVQFPGGSYRLNSQMQRLKFLEFAMAAILPRLHRRLRRRYNRCGPRLAVCCRKNRWLADLVFLALLPLGLLSTGLRILLRIAPDLVESIYRCPKD